MMNSAYCNLLGYGSEQAGRYVQVFKLNILAFSIWIEVNPEHGATMFF
jgi:hypothetical protein